LLGSGWPFANEGKRIAAIFDILQTRGLVGAESHAQARLLLARVVQMLARMSGTLRDA
jgi:hypothetical protein